MKNINTIGRGLLQIVLELILGPDVRVCLVIGQTKTLCLKREGGGCDGYISHQIREKVLELCTYELFLTL